MLLSRTHLLTKCQASAKVQSRNYSVTIRPVRQGSFVLCQATPDGSLAKQDTVVDFKKLSDIISAQALSNLTGEQQFALQAIADELGVPVATVKNMVYKRKSLATMEPATVRAKIAQVAEVVDVSLDKAKQMVIIQPGLLTDTDRQAAALHYGLQAICYDLKAPKEEIVDLIINNPSVLHGREMHLSVADVAHLAMIREPRSRIVD